MTNKHKLYNLKNLSAAVVVLIIAAVGARLIFTTHASQLTGDTNGNGVVNISDLSIMAAHYGTASGATWSMGDFNGDGAVNINDLAILAAHYGDTLSNLPTVPSGLSATATSSSTVNLSWTADSSSGGTITYLIYRNGTKINTTTATSYGDSGLTAGDTYSYSIAASNSNGISDQSSAVNVTTTIVYTVPSSIPDDCSVAVDTQLEAFIATVPDDSTIQFQTNGCYDVNETIKLPYLSNITVNGEGSTFKDTVWPTNNSIWEAQGGSNITFENMTIDGANAYAGCLQGDSSGPCATQGCYTASYEWQYGVDFEGTQGGTVNNVTVNDVGGDFVETEDLNGNVNSVPTTGITIENSTFTNSGRMGIGITDGNGVTIENNTFSGVCWEMVDMESDVSVEFSKNVSIINNTLGSNDFGILSDGGNSAATNNGNVTVTGNTMTSLPATTESPIILNPITGVVSNGFTIDNNTLETNGSAGIQIVSESNGQIENNNVDYDYPEGGTHNGIDIESGDSNILVENNIEPVCCSLTGWPGGGLLVYVDPSDTNITVSGNTL